MMCWCEMVGQAWGNCVSRGEEQAGSFCFSYNAPSYTSYNALKNCWCWFFAVVESVLVQPSTCSPECYHGLHIVHCSIMCNAVQCSVVQCSAVQCGAVQCSGASYIYWGSTSWLISAGEGEREPRTTHSAAILTNIFSIWTNTICNFEKYMLMNIHVYKYSL